MEENTLLEVKDLRVVYKTDEATVHAVNGISFTLGERETIGLVGETGAGKTTTALTLLRLLANDVVYLLHQLREADGFPVQLHAAGLDSAHIQNIVNQSQQIST